MVNKKRDIIGSILENKKTFTFLFSLLLIIALFMPFISGGITCEDQDTPNDCFAQSCCMWSAAGECVDACLEDCPLWDICGLGANICSDEHCDYCSTINSCLNADCSWDYTEGGCSNDLDYNYCFADEDVDTFPYSGNSVIFTSSSSECNVYCDGLYKEQCLDFDENLCELTGDSSCSNWLGGGVVGGCNYVSAEDCLTVPGCALSQQFLPTCEGGIIDCTTIDHEICDALGGCYLRPTCTGTVDCNEHKDSAGVCDFDVLGVCETVALGGTFNCVSKNNPSNSISQCEDYYNMVCGEVTGCTTNYNCETNGVTGAPDCNSLAWNQYLCVESGCIFSTEVTSQTCFGQRDCSQYAANEATCEQFFGCKYYPGDTCESPVARINFILGDDTSEFDCNDLNSNINPGRSENSEEYCSDEIDNNCNGKIDCNDLGCSSLGICTSNPEGPNSVWMNRENTEKITSAVFNVKDTLIITQVLNNSGQLEYIDIADIELLEYDSGTQTSSVVSSSYYSQQKIIGGTDDISLLGWDLTINDAFVQYYGQGEDDNKLELYFVVTTTEGGVYTSGYFDLMVIGDGNTYWEDPNSEEIIHNLVYDGTSQTMDMVLNDSGLVGDHVVFYVYEGGEEIQAGGGNQLDFGGRISRPFVINSTLIASFTEVKEVYDVYFKAVNSENPEVEYWISEILTIDVTGSTILPPAFNDLAYWMDSPPENHISGTVELTGEELEVTMTFAGLGLSAEEVIFYIYEYDDGSAIGLEGGVTGGVISNFLTGMAVEGEEEGTFQQTLTFTLDSLEQLDDGDDTDGIYEIYFEVNDNSDWRSGILTVDASEAIPPTGDPEFYWSDLEGIFPIEQFEYKSGDTDTVTLKIENTDLTPGTSVVLDIKEADGFLCGNDEIRTVTGTVNQAGTVVVVWTMNDTDFENALDNLCLVGDQESGDIENNEYEFYFETVSVSGESPELNTFFSGAIEPCDFINLCVDYTTQEPCDGNDCNIIPEFAGIDCSSSDYTCNCTWDTTVDPNACGPTFTSSSGGIEIGTCTHQNDLSSDDCEDGFLSYSWDIKWVWSANNPTMAGLETCADPEYVFSPIDNLCHYDPIGSRANCEGGSNVVACPAQIQLSFFSTLNIIAAIVLLIIVYYLLKNQKKTKKKTKKKKVSKKKK